VHRRASKLNICDGYWMRGHLLPFAAGVPDARSGAIAGTTAHGNLPRKHGRVRGVPRPMLHDRHQSATGSLAVGQRARGAAVGCRRDLKPERTRRISSQPLALTTPPKSVFLPVAASRAGKTRYATALRADGASSSTLRSACRPQQLHGHVPGGPLLSAGNQLGIHTRACRPSTSLSTSTRARHHRPSHSVLLPLLLLLLAYPCSFGPAQSSLCARRAVDTAPCSL
jgi:hypothetical protein